jgi:hypothetical protein
VIGVAITLSLSYWISIKNEKRDISLYFNAIKLELDENITTLESAIEDLLPSLRYTDYLKAHDKDSLDKDSLKSYQHASYSFTSYSFKTNAFEMFKNSGVMRLVDEKEILLLLWDVYDEFSTVKEAFDVFFPIKWEDIKKETALLLDGKEVKVPMYHFFRLGLPYDLLVPCERALRKSKEMTAKLEDTKMTKPLAKPADVADITE